MARPKVSVFLATSMDGFIAGKNGELDWLAPAQSADAGGGDYGYGALMESVDAAVMGRGTYDAIVGMGAWPFGGRDVRVLTRRQGELANGARRHSGPLAPLLAELHEAGRRHVYLDGGQTVRQGLREDVVDTLIVSVIPVLLGDGIPLFGPGTPGMRWRTVSAHAYASGLVQLEWARHD